MSNYTNMDGYAKMSDYTSMDGYVNHQALHPIRRSDSLGEQKQEPIYAELDPIYAEISENRQNAGSAASISNSPKLPRRNEGMIQPPGFFTRTFFAFTTKTSGLWNRFTQQINTLGGDIRHNLERLFKSSEKATQENTHSIAPLIFKENLSSEIKASPLQIPIIEQNKGNLNSVYEELCNRDNNGYDILIRLMFNGKPVSQQPIYVNVSTLFKLPQYSNSRPIPAPRNLAKQQGNEPLYANLPGCKVS
jgi:hypothetical protein